MGDEQESVGRNRHAPILFTPEEVGLIADADFFRAKARIMAKVRGQMEAIYAGLQEELAGEVLLAPTGFDPAKRQFVKPSARCCR